MCVYLCVCVRAPADAVGIMDGAHEGAFAWLTLNYLLGKLEKGPGETVAAIDLGGGSVQEAFALTGAQATAAPAGYITPLKAGGTTFNVYVHRWVRVWAGSVDVCGWWGVGLQAHAGRSGVGGRKFLLSAALTLLF